MWAAVYGLLGPGLLGTGTPRIFESLELIGHCLSWEDCAQIHLSVSLPSWLQQYWGCGMLGPSETGLKSQARQVDSVL